MAVQGNLEDDVDWSVYITLPEFPDDSPVTHVPLAILLHGFSYPDINAYQGWITHLTAKGMAVAFIQYPSDIRPDGHEEHEATYEAGMSDYLQHTYRDLAIRAGMDHVNDVLLDSSRAPEIDAHLGEVVVDPTTLWTGGHSLGASYTFLTLNSAFERGWGPTRWWLRWKHLPADPCKPPFSPT